MDIEDIFISSCCCGIIIYLIFIAALIFAGAGLLFWVWGLFVVPFFGVPLLTFWQAFGIVICIYLLYIFLKGIFSRR